MSPGDAAVCRGEIAHRRTRPTVNEFTNQVSYVWLDPDRPDELCRGHSMWSARRPAPARFRRSDYGDASRPEVSLGDQARDDLAAVLGHRPNGAVRMITQTRRWGWLFNPISVYLLWEHDGSGASVSGPVGAVLEVTNTPWKERHRYAVALHPATTENGCRYETRLDKAMHVSPFLDLGYRYDVVLEESPATGLCFSIDVVADQPEDGTERSAAVEPILHTALRVRRVPATARSLRQALIRDVFPTHRVTFAIHWQALRLWVKRVPFVPHPKKSAG